ncbi:MAG: prephenate dehydrogenase/arogenate dehydrogenase family protein [Candidatus Woesearchaeota archaeon]
MEIKALRKQIDDIDDTIIKLLKSRQDVVDAVANFKAKTNYPIVDVIRENEIVDRLKKKAVENNIEPRLVENIITTIMAHSKKHQEEKLSIPKSDIIQNDKNNPYKLKNDLHELKKLNLKIGIIGFGRFGKLLVQNLSGDFDVSVFALDADRNKVLADDIISSGGKIKSLQDVCNNDIIIPAVPISEFEKVIKQISPLLRKGVLVMDVCSVKQFPAEIMKKNLPRYADILATHPMFGPDSAADGFVGKKIVVCKIKINDLRYKSIVSLFRQMGLVVIETTPEEHDKQIAETQVLTHFIGRALIDMGAEEHKIDTEGYKRLIHILGVVGKDTDQLFKDMNNFNSSSADVRRKFVDSLKKLDDNIKNKNFNCEVKK